MNIFIGILFFLLLSIVFYVILAYLVYKRVRPVDRACIYCPNPVHVNGYDLYYRELGADGEFPPVVLVHGGPGRSSNIFKNSFDYLSSLTRVVYYDQRGCGNSQIKPVSDDYNIEALIAELETLRREVIRSEKINLVAHDFGSILAQRYALKFPQHVEKLVLISPQRINSGHRSLFFWKWFGPALVAPRLGFPPVSGREADKWFANIILREDIKRLFDPAQAHLLKNIGNISFAPWREIMLSVAGLDYMDELRQMEIPTLITFGEAELKQKGKSAADELSNLLPYCSSIGFEKSGNWLFLEEPEQFRQVLMAFLVPSKLDLSGKA